MKIRMSTDKNARLELGAEFLAACTNSVQAAESWAFALHGRGAYPLDKLLGPILSRRMNRLVAGIVAVAYAITAIGETLKVLGDVAGEPSTA